MMARTSRLHAALPCALAILLGAAGPAARQDAIHPVATQSDLRRWLARVPVTRAFPPDLAETMRSAAGLFLVEMSTAPGCIPCGDLWSTLGVMHARYGWRIGTISAQEALVRSGRLGLPWVGHPVAWVRAAGDTNRIIPVAVGTDHAANLVRNLYLAAKMLEGVRPAVGVRGMARYTGIVGAPGARAPGPGGKD